MFCVTCRQLFDSEETKSSHKCDPVIVNDKNLITVKWFTYKELEHQYLERLNESEETFFVYKSNGKKVATFTKRPHTR